MDNDDLGAARGIMYAVPAALVLWGLAAGIYWALSPMMAEERTIDVIVAELLAQ